MESSSNANSLYTEGGVAVRTSHLFGGRIQQGTATTNLIGVYNVGNSSQGSSTSRENGFSVTLSGDLTLGSPTGLLTNGAVSGNAVASLRYADLRKTSTATDQSSYSENGGRSTLRKTEVVLDPTVANGGSTRTRVTSHQTGRFTENEESTDTYNGTAIGGFVEVTGGAGLGGSSTTGSIGGTTYVGGSLTGGVSYGREDGTSMATSWLTYRAKDHSEGDVVRTQTDDTGKAPENKPAKKVTTRVSAESTHRERLNAGQTLAEDSAYQLHNDTAGVSFAVSFGWTGLGLSWTTESSATDVMGERHRGQRWAYQGRYGEENAFEQTTTQVDDKPPTKEYRGLKRTYGMDEALHQQSRREESSTWTRNANGASVASGTANHQSGDGRTFTHEENGTVSLPLNSQEFNAEEAVFDDLRWSNSDGHSTSAEATLTTDNVSHSESRRTLHQEGTGFNAIYEFNDFQKTNSDGQRVSTPSFGPHVTERTWFEQTQRRYEERDAEGFVDGYTEIIHTMGFSRVTVFNGFTFTEGGSSTSTGYWDVPPGGVTLFAGHSFHVPSRQIGDVEVWAGAVLKVYSDHQIMMANGATFGQVPFLNSRAESLRGEYGDFVYYTLYGTGAVGSIAAITAVTIATGGNVWWLVGGGALGFGFSSARQGLEYLDGSRDEFSLWEAVNAAGAGYVFAGLFNCRLPVGLTRAAQFGFAGMGVVSGLGEMAAGNYRTGVFDLVTSIVPFLFERACFAAGTPLLTPDGEKAIEDFRVGDLILSRSEFDSEGKVEARVVEEVFVRHAHLLNLHVGGQVIRTTAEHPFWVVGKGWAQASGLKNGDELLSHDGQRVVVEEVFDSGEYAEVYNLRVASYHTYFVGDISWGWSVWAHNASDGYFSGLEDKVNLKSARIAKAITRVENAGYPPELAAAASRLGISLREIRIAMGVAELRIGYAQSLRPADILILRTYLMEQGATRAIVNSGAVIRPKLATILTRNAQSGRAFAGARVEIINRRIRSFRLTFDSLE